MDPRASAEGKVRPGPAADAERLRAILETAREAIVTADASGHIVDFNPAAERMFGLSAADAMGASLTTLMPERFHPAHEAGLRRFLETREPKVIGHTLELAGQTADGEEFPLELSLVAFELKGQLFFTGILSDITQRKRDEAYRNTQHELSGILMEAPSVRAAVTQLMRTLGERLDWQGGAYWAGDEARGRIRCEAIWHDPELDPALFVQATRAVELERGAGLPGRAWASGAVAWIEDVV